MILNQLSPSSCKQPPGDEPDQDPWHSEHSKEGPRFLTSSWREKRAAAQDPAQLSQSTLCPAAIKRKKWTRKCHLPLSLKHKHSFFFTKCNGNTYLFLYSGIFHLKQTDFFCLVCCSCLRLIYTATGNEDYYLLFTQYTLLTKSSPRRHTSKLLSNRKQL